VPVHKVAQAPVSKPRVLWSYRDMKNQTVTKLPTRAPRKGSSETTIGSGRLGTLTKASGLGKEMVANLSKVKRTYAAQVKADRRAAALERREAEVAADNARVAELYN
jgi:hypothetical protein